MTNLILAVGSPASGKSTWIRENLKENDIRISRDEVRFSLLEDGDEYFEKEDTVFENFMRIINNSINCGKYENVYIDATHLNEKSRNKVLDKINTKDYNLKAVVFKTSLETCLERNSKREGLERVPETALKRMWLSQTNPRGDQKYRYSEVIEIKEQII